MFNSVCWPSVMSIVQVSMRHWRTLARDTSHSVLLRPELLHHCTGVRSLRWLQCQHPVSNTASSHHPGNTPLVSSLATTGIGHPTQTRDKRWNNFGLSNIFQQWHNVSRKSNFSDSFVKFGFIWSKIILRIFESKYFISSRQAGEVAAIVANYFFNCFKFWTSLC